MISSSISFHNPQASNEWQKSNSETNTYCSEGTFKTNPSKTMVQEPIRDLPKISSQPNSSVKLDVPKESQFHYSGVSRANIAQSEPGNSNLKLKLHFE